MGDKHGKKRVPSGLPGPLDSLMGDMDFAILTPTAQVVVYSTTVFFLALAILLGGAYMYGNMRAQRLEVAAPGQLVDLGGYSLHLECHGKEGGKTVILDADAGRFSADWQGVVAELKSNARVCTYDRSGLGWSEPFPSPSAHISRLNDRVASHMATELYYTLRWAGVKGPLVLVGEGLGALVSQYYAARYGGVSSLVLIDPYTPAMADHATFTSQWEKTWRDNFLRWAGSYIGAYDAMLDFGYADDGARGYDKVAEPYATKYEQMRGDYTYYRSIIEEYGLMEDSLAEYAKLIESKGKINVPATIVSRATLCSHASAEANTAWTKLQAEAGSEYASVTRVVVDGADCMLPVNQPAVVAKHIAAAL